MKTTIRAHERKSPQGRTEHVRRHLREVKGTSKPVNEMPPEEYQEGADHGREKEGPDQQKEKVIK